MRLSGAQESKLRTADENVIIPRKRKQAKYKDDSKNWLSIFAILVA
jgi:hypothetical protein